MYYTIIKLLQLEVVCIYYTPSTFALVTAHNQVCAAISDEQIRFTWERNLEKNTISFYSVPQIGIYLNKYIELVQNLESFFIIHFLFEFLNIIFCLFPEPWSPLSGMKESMKADFALQFNLKYYYQILLLA